MFSDFEQLRESFREELRLWPPSEQNFEETFVKAKARTGIQRFCLSEAQKEALLEIFNEARTQEWQTISRKKKVPNKSSQPTLTTKIVANAAELVR